MFKAHIYLDEKLIFNRRMEDVPRVGDSLRFPGERYGIVTEVVWCLDEPSHDGQRVNIGAESEEANNDKSAFDTLPDDYETGDY